MVTPQAALHGLSLSGFVVTEGELERALRHCGIETSNVGDRLTVEIKAFGVVDHFEQAQASWKDFAAWKAWAGKCKTTKVGAAKVFNALW